MTLRLKNLFWSVLLSLSMLLLTACQDSNTYHYYVLHPKKLWIAMEQCKRLSSPSLLIVDERCQTIYRAAIAVHALALEFVNNQQAFGRKLLAEQEKAAHLEAAFAKNNNTKIFKKLAAIRLQIKMRLVVLKLLSAP